jgi:hypothetical protein
MGRRLGALVLGITLGLSVMPGTAWARDGRGGRCEGREGNCNDQRRCSDSENCTDNHKSFSPDLKDSPTTLNICLPGSTCYFDGSGQQKPPPKGGDGSQPKDEAAEPNPACLVFVPFHCDPPPKR